MPTHLRVARPVGDLECSATMYREGLGWSELGRFENHEGFDGVMLGRPELDYHLELAVSGVGPLQLLDRFAVVISAEACFGA